MQPSTHVLKTCNTTDPFVFKVGLFPNNMYYVDQCAVEQIERTGSVHRTLDCPWPSYNIEALQILVARLPWTVHLLLYKGIIPWGTIYPDGSITSGSQLELLHNGTVHMPISAAMLTEQRSRMFQHSKVITYMEPYHIMTTDKPTYPKQTSHLIELFDPGIVRELVKLPLVAWLLYIAVAAVTFAATAAIFRIKVWSFIRGLLPNQSWEMSDRHYATMRCCLAPLSILALFMYTLYSNTILVQIMQPRSEPPHAHVAQIYTRMKSGSMKLAMHSKTNLLVEKMADVYTDFPDVLLKNPIVDITEKENWNVWTEIGMRRAVYAAASTGIDGAKLCVCNAITAPIDGLAGGAETVMKRGYLFNKNFSGEHLRMFDEQIERTRSIIDLIVRIYDKGKPFKHCTPASCTGDRMAKLGEVLAALVALAIGTALAVAACCCELAYKRRQQSTTAAVID